MDALMRLIALRSTVRDDIFSSSGLSWDVWKVATIGALAPPQRVHGHTGREGLVDVHDVEGARVEPALDHAGRRRAHPDPGDRSVEGDGNAGTHLGDRLVDTRDPRGEDGNAVPAGPQRLGELQHVALDAAVDVQVVRADQADPHQTAPSPGTGSTNTRCSMCQSAGLFRRPSENPSAIA